jgi:hypothetical protein
MKSPTARLSTDDERWSTIVKSVVGLLGDTIVDVCDSACSCLAELIETHPSVMASRLGIAYGSLHTFLSNTFVHGILLLRVPFNRYDYTWSSQSH